MYFNDFFLFGTRNGSLLEIYDNASTEYTWIDGDTVNHIEREECRPVIELE